MTDNVIQFPLVTAEDRRLCDRAAAHSADLTRLPIEARFRGGITDLDVARVILAVERGSVIMQIGGVNRWGMIGPGKMNEALLTRVVDEMLRTGLAAALSKRVRHEVVAVHIRVAPVHFRAVSNDLRASCHSKKLRIRRTDVRDLVDCPSCLTIRR